MEEIGLLANMVMVTRSGTNGRVQIIPRYMTGWAASEDANRIVSLNDVVSGYIYAWLASVYGQELLLMHQYGSVITHIDRDMLASIPVPLPGEEKMKEVAEAVLSANRLRNL